MYLFFFLVLFSLLLLLLLLFFKHYNPSWILASKTILYSFRCVTTVYQFLCLITCRSSSTSPVHLIRCLPLFIVSSIVTHYLFGILSLFIVSVCIYHGSVSDFMNFTMFAPCNASLYLFFYSPVFFLFYGTINWSFSLPFKIL